MNYLLGFLVAGVGLLALTVKYLGHRVNKLKLDNTILKNSIETIALEAERKVDREALSVTDKERMDALAEIDRIENLRIDNSNFQPDKPWRPGESGDDE